MMGGLERLFIHELRKHNLLVTRTLNAQRRSNIKATVEEKLVVLIKQKMSCDDSFILTTSTKKCLRPHFLVITSGMAWILIIREVTNTLVSFEIAITPELVASI